MTAPYSEADMLARVRAAYELGYKKGRGEGEAVTLADWVRGIAKSKTMWTGVGGTLVGLCGIFLPVAEELLRDMALDPKTMALVSAAMIVLRVFTNKPLADK